MPFFGLATEAMAPTCRKDLHQAGDAKRPSVGFLFLGGAHQVLHVAPAALELEQRGLAKVRLLAGGEAERSALIDFWHRLGLAEPKVELLPRPRWARILARAVPRWAAKKSLKILAARTLLLSFDAVVAAERTCTILKRVPGRKPYLIHIPHGAGDRARGFEWRIGLFDHVIVAGEKDRERLIAETVCRAADVSVSGYVKLAAVRLLRQHATAERLFGDDKPIALYNPHCAPNLSSWLRYSDALIAAFAGQQDFNLVIAPHVRLFEKATESERRAVEARAVPGRIRIDLGSPLSNDMTYTLSADIYIGDVSSQAYEFLQTLKPCVFLDAGVGEWRFDPSFNFWHLGEVVTDPADVLDAVRRASKAHARFAPVQLQARELALGPTEPSPISTAARSIAALADAARAQLAR